MKNCLFHSFSLGDVEDPEIYAAVPLNEFMNTEKGQWLKEHCSDLQYRIRTDNAIWGYRVDIYGPIDPELELFFKLKYSGV